MGYAGEIEGIVTPYSNDDGIDGIIKEDVLGWGHIHIQAKRYATDTKISREEIQKFIGVLAGAQSSKGMFITTSSYNNMLCFKLFFILKIHFNYLLYYSYYICI